MGSHIRNVSIITPKQPLEPFNIPINYFKDLIINMFIEGEKAREKNGILNFAKYQVMFRPFVLAAYLQI